MFAWITTQQAAHRPAFNVWQMPGLYVRRLILGDPRAGVFGYDGLIVAGTAKFLDCRGLRPDAMTFADVAFLPPEIADSVLGL